VSQAEAVRRAVEGAEALLDDNRAASALTALKRYHEQTGGLDTNVAEAYLNEVYEGRKDWGR